MQGRMPPLPAESVIVNECEDMTVSYLKVDPYASLDKILRRAFEQASEGKGYTQHVQVEDEPFEQQQICEMARRLKGHPAAGPLFQAVKKIYESGRFAERGDMSEAIGELLGAIVYTAAAIIVLED